MGITDYRYNCGFLHTINGIARISENKHLIGGEIFHRFMSCINQSSTMFYMTMWQVFCMPVLVFWCIIYMRASRGHGMLAACWGRTLSQIRRECCGLYVLVRPHFWVEEECGCGLPWESLWTAGVLRRAQGHCV